jgi:hypothetical protein
MSLIWIVACALAAPPAGEPASASAAELPAASAGDNSDAAGELVAPRPPQELRRAIRAALRNAAGLVRNDSTEEELVQAAWELLPVYDELRHDGRMVETDRNKYGGILRGRLKKIAKDLSAKLPAEGDVPPEQVTGEATPSSQTFGSVTVDSPGGRSVEDAGRELVELIQRTISPESWDVNGGPGTIMFYPPLRVLVIRASRDVHGEVGGVLGQLQGP